jgi:hypothetical protein
MNCWRILLIRGTNWAVEHPRRWFLWRIFGRSNQWLKKILRVLSHHQWQRKKWKFLSGRRRLFDHFLITVVEKWKIIGSFRMPSIKASAYISTRHLTPLLDSHHIGANRENDFREFSFTVIRRFENEASLLFLFFSWKILFSLEMLILFLPLFSHTLSGMSENSYLFFTEILYR